jgi:hypothetical protein
MPFTTFDVNIFGTTHVDLDGSNANGFRREFVIHVLQVECNQTITNFDMFIEFYAFTYPNFVWVASANSDNMFLNQRPQVMHIDTMTPNSPVALYPSCNISPALPCPAPADIRLTSQTFQVPVVGFGYDTDITDMYNEPLVDPAQLPVKITIIADGCRYTSPIDTTINIYKDYEGGSTEGALFGGPNLNPNNYPIGFNEKITIS